MYTHTFHRCLRPLSLALVALALIAVARPEVARAQDEAAEAYQRAYEMVLDEAWNDASAALNDFLDAYSRSAWVDDAEFWRCYVHEKSGRSEEDAFACYQDFVDDYSGSKWSDDARANMVQLARSLARDGKREYMTIIESMQAAGDEEVKLAALDALWQMGDENALDAVLDLYSSSGSEKFRKKIVFALSQFETPRAAEKLKEIALQDPNPKIRKEAIFWIGQQGGTDVIPLLEEIAQQDDSEEVQKSIVFALSQLGEAGVPELIRIARTHPNPKIQKDAIFWLSQNGGSEVIDFFSELIDTSTDKDVQKGLVFAFSHLGRDGVPYLIDIARTHREPEIQKDAIFWLSQNGGSEVIDFFSELIDSSTDEEVQKGLVFAFSQLVREGVPYLIDIARTHRVPEIRKDAIFWLSQVGGADVIDFFGELINESDEEEVQKGLVFAFSQLGREGVPHLIRIAKTHDSPAVRKDAIFWLGQTNDARAREALLEIVRGND